MSEATSKWLNSIEGLQDIAEIFRAIQIDNRSYEYVLDAYDHADSLFYIDPPYDEEKRSSGSDYEFDFTRQAHIDLRDTVVNVKGMVAISGYNSELMLDLYKDWYIIVGPERKNNFSKRQGVNECLFTNYDPALKVKKQLSLEL